MSDPQQPPSGLGIPASVWIALILSVAGVFALSQKPFQDARPPATTAPLHHHSGSDGQTIEARLWEDPLSAVASARNATLASLSASSSAKGPNHEWSVSALQTSISEYAKQRAKTLVLAVIVTGEPYADDIETRRRTRYAVLAGLYRSGFVPTNPDHIGYVLPKSAGSVKPICSGPGDGESASPPEADVADEHEIVAFEWFKRDNAEIDQPPRPGGEVHESADATTSDHALVLWLDQEAFRHLPIRKLSGFLTTITGAKQGLADVAVLGPADSDGLRAMYEEVKLDCWQPGDLRSMNFYSSRATASDQSIINVAPDAPANLAKTLFDHTQGQVRFYRTVVNDKDVETAVWAKLQDRGVDSFGKIALVFERDTLYARGMGSYFGGGCRNPPRPDLSVPSKDDRKHVACFTYLKGLDGLVPPAPTSANAGSTVTSSQSQGSGTNSSSTAGAQPSAPADQGFGPGQLDYLRRLAGTIAGLRETGGRIRAVGVISSDVYDKLLVLQALRNAFPGPIYFTFDLDARLVDPNNLKWTRQLIVGSGLGLELRPDLQGDIPPFRDSYQTATFYATILGVHRFVNSGNARSVQSHPAAPQNADAGAPGTSYFFDPDSDRQAGLQWTRSPRVFEIGRSQEFDLTAATNAQPCDLDGDCPSVSAGRQSWLWSQSYVLLKGLVLGAVLALLCLAGLTLALGVRGVVGRSRTHLIPGLGERRWSNELGSAALAIAVIVVTAFAWPYIVERILQRGMPAPLFGGANQRISSAVDVLSIIVVVLLVVRGQRKLNDNAESVGREFGFKRTRRKLVELHLARRHEVEEQRKSAPPLPAAVPAAGGSQWELPRWLIWFWFPLRPLSRRTGIDLATTEFSQVEAIIAQYLYHGRARARIRRVLPVTLVVVFLIVAPLEEIAGIAFFGRWSDALSLLSLLAMQFLVFWSADASLLSRSFILALKRDRPAWPDPMVTLGVSTPLTAQWLDLRLVAARTRSVVSLVWYPSFVIGVMAIAALTIQFRQFQFANNPIALAVGIVFLVGSAVALRRSAEALRSDVKRCLENEQLRAAADAPSEKRLELLFGRVSDLHDGAFAPYSEQPIVRAVLVPIATYGATVGAQYLHFGS